MDYANELDKQYSRIRLSEFLEALKGMEGLDQKREFFEPIWADITHEEVKP